MNLKQDDSLKIKPKSFSSVLKSHLKRSFLEIINIFLNHNFIFYLIGLLNKKFNLIESVFLVYPANEEYGLSFAYSLRLKKNKWDPWPTGLLWQNSKLIIMFAISSTDNDFNDPSNFSNLKSVVVRMEKIKSLFAAKRKTFAGILPGILFLKRIINEVPEADLTAKIVVKSIEMIKTRELLGSVVPVIVLGGKGFVGRRTVNLLGKSNVWSIDINNGYSDWPSHLKGKRVIVVNITVNNAIKNYIEFIWPGTLVLNEVYPEPSLEILQKISLKGSCCYHVVGVKAKAFPKFPSVYKGAIPCCAAWPSEEMEVVIRKIS